MSEDAVRKMLEEDSEIDTFFSNYKIININQEILTSEINSNSKSENKNTYIPLTGKFSPLDRFNILLKMKGEFTSRDYMKYVLDNYKAKIARYVAFDDISTGLKSSKLELVKKSGRYNIYKVIDSSSIDQKQYTAILKNKRIQINAIQ